MSDSVIRPARPDELDAIVRVSIAGFGAFDDGGDRDAFRDRCLRRLERDPGGAWVAEAPGGELDGVALAVVREGIWALASLVVHPAAQSGGIGRRLIAAARAYGDDCHGFMIGSDLDGRAWRLYHGLGLRMRPCVQAEGVLDRALLPVLPSVRDGDERDVEELAQIDREIRGGGRAEDLVWALGRGDRLYRTDDGYVMGREGTARMLVAREDADARALLWRMFADTPAGKQARVGWISAEQQWAFDVALAARLKPANTGPYFTGGRLGPLRPFLPNGALL